MWYAAYFCYLIGAELDPSRSVTVRVQEDLILLAEDTTERALKKALGLGEESGKFAQNYLNADPSTLERLSAGGWTVAEWPSLMHPSVSSIYAQFSFLGIRRLVPLAGEPANGREIDVMHLNLTPSDMQELVRMKHEMQAYSPAGPAYDGEGKVAHEQKLFEEYHWYLAEELLIAGAGENREPATLSRLVLLEGSGPDNSFGAAMADGASWAAARSVPTQFVGLGNLWVLTETTPGDCCELRSQIIEEPAAEFLASLKLFAGPATSAQYPSDETRSGARHRPAGGS